MAATPVGHQEGPGVPGPSHVGEVLGSELIDEEPPSLLPYHSCLLNNRFNSW